MENHKHTDKPTDAPSKLDLARLELNDVTALALDNMRGVAYALDMMADDSLRNEESLALHMLAATLRDNASSVEGAMRGVDALAADVTATEVM